MDLQVLGDKKKQRRYDESLVDKVNAKYAKEVIIPDQEIITPVPKLLTPNVSNLHFDVFRPSGIPDKNQESWKEYWQKNNMQLMTAGEFYEYSEWLKNNEEDPKVIKKILESKNGLITESNVHYVQKPRSDIISVMSTQRAQKRWCSFSVKNKKPTFVAKDKAALVFLLDLFNTDEPCNAFFQVLEYVSGVYSIDHSRVLVSFENLFENDADKVRNVIIETYHWNYNGEKRFIVQCDKKPNYKGRSLGVKYKTQERKWTGKY